MFSPPEKFTLELNSVKMEIVEMDLPGYTAFRVVFSSKRKPVVVARARKESGLGFWTSIPEGRQKEAEGIGKLIEEHLKSKAKN